MREKTDFNTAIQGAFKITQHTNRLLASDEFISCAPTSRISIDEAYAADAGNHDNHPVAQSDKKDLVSLAQMPDEERMAAGLYHAAR
jgi:hypothetical protein